MGVITKKFFTLLKVRSRVFLQLLSRYQWTEAGELRHVFSGKCVVPGSVSVQLNNQNSCLEFLLKENKFCSSAASMTSKSSGEIRDNDNLVLSDKCDKVRFVRHQKAMRNSAYPNKLMSPVAKYDIHSSRSFVEPVCVHIWWIYKICCWDQEGHVHPRSRGFEGSWVIQAAESNFVRKHQRSSSGGTSVVLHSGCGLERNQFFLITVEPINCIAIHKYMQKWIWYGLHNQCAKNWVLRN